MKFNSKSILAGAFASLISTSAFATGFSTEGLDHVGTLFDYKKFVFTGSFAHVRPNRTYSNGDAIDEVGAPVTGDTSSKGADDYHLYGADVKLGMGDNLDCVMQMQQPWNATGNTDDDWVGRNDQRKFYISSESVDGTCSIKFPVSDKALFRVIGGIRTLKLEAERTNAFGATYGGIIQGAFGLAGPPALNEYKFSQDNIGHGYRIGAAYEVPGIAMRASVIYDSGIDMSLGGTQTMYSAMGTPVLQVPVSTEVTLPQSVTARFQTAVNETTLVWAGVKWQEWGSIKSLDISVNTGNPAIDVPLAKSLTTGWSDGWTVGAGVGKKLSDKLSVTGSVTWNQGIGGGYTDSYTFATGASITVSENVKFNLGTSATLLTSSTETDSGGGAGIEEVTYKQGNDWAYAAGAQIVISFD